MSVTHYSELETRQQRKTFAHTLDATSYILRRLHFPVHKLRDVVDALQGASGGREEFDLSHLSLARRLRHTGDEGAAQRYAQRKVAALRAAQEQSGRLLFTISSDLTIGADNKIKRTPMHYVDHLTPAANWMMQQARASDLWAKHPARAIEAFTEAAIEMLPLASTENKPEGATMPLDDEQYIQRMINQSVNCALKACDRVASNGGDDLAVAQMAADRLLRYVAQRHKERQTFKPTNLSAWEKPKKNEDSPAELPQPTEESAPDSHLQKCGGEIKKTEKSKEPSEMHAAALALAARGYRVFPVWWIDDKGRCACKLHEKCQSPGKHPRITMWQQFASSDPNKFKCYWRSWPRANIGIVTDDLIVPDIDPRNGGDVTISELIEQYGPLPETAEVRTGGNGLHIIFARPQGVEIRNFKLGEGVDIKTNGGFIVGAGSLHISGRRYEWLNDLPPAGPPEWLLKLLRTPQDKVACIRRENAATG